MKHLRPDSKEWKEAKTKLVNELSQLEDSLAIINEEAAKLNAVHLANHAIDIDTDMQPMRDFSLEWIEEQEKSTIKGRMKSLLKRRSACKDEPEREC